MSAIERYNGAIVVRAEGFRRPEDSLDFFITHPSESLQVALMKRPSGHEVKPHIHDICYRKIMDTQEVIIMQKGTMRVTIYPDMEDSISIRLGVGDLIVLQRGGHSMEMLGDCEFVEVKQGPFVQGEKKFF